MVPMKKAATGLGDRAAADHHVKLSVALTLLQSSPVFATIAVELRLNITGRAETSNGYIQRA